MASRGAARLARPVRAMLAAAAAALSLAGCVSMPSGGPVLSYPLTQGPDAQSQPYLQIVTGPPGKNWTPRQIVQGFLTASASFGDHSQVAREYLTGHARTTWRASWSAVVYRDGPNVSEPVYLKDGGKTEATVTVTGNVQANLSGNGSYAVPSVSAPAGPPGGQPTFRLSKVRGQWRISSAPAELLLTKDSFRSDYQLRNLYFFDPSGRFLVPDPVYVPMQATPEDLMNGLVQDLINPPDDWLSGGATQTAFPAGTKLSAVTLDGVTAVINLGGAIAKASGETLQEVSAQLLWTLVGSGQSGQGVQSVEVEVNGKAWIPGNSQGNPVQRVGRFAPATGAGKTFYYLDGDGQVLSEAGPQGKQARVARIGSGFSSVAVSPDGKYLAALKQGELFIGPLGGPLTQRSGTGYTTMSWDPSDNLWATTTQPSDQIVMLRADSGTGRRSASPIPVSVYSSDGVSAVSGPYTAVRVAPDGVRVAIVVDGTALNFGAISWEEGTSVGNPTLRVRIVLSPFFVLRLDAAFTSLTWYGAGDVITLAQPGPYVTEYPVNGGTATDIPAQPDMTSITASAGSALIAGLGNGRLVSDASLTGSWMPIGKGAAPVYPG